LEELSEALQYLTTNSNKYLIFIINILIIIRLVSNCKHVVIDEAMVTYQPSHEIKKKTEENGEPIPVMYIERKPHPNGLLIYVACGWIPHPTKNNKILSFVIDILPHLTVGDVNPIETVRLVMKRLLLIVFFINIY
jgi:hypothetical protein